MIRKLISFKPTNLVGLTRARLVRFLSDPAATASSAVAEKQLEDKLKETFPKATGIKVKDVSGGCGAMFEIYVVSDDFKGLSRVKQHQKITQALKSEIKDMHGCRIFTGTE